MPPHPRPTSSTGLSKARTAPVDGFTLAYDRSGAGEPVVLLHGWPGDRTDYQALVPLLDGQAEVVVPDLRGFGESDKHPAQPADAYSAAAQARGVLGLVDELGLRAPVLAGYDLGSRIAQAAARAAPDRVRALVLSPPLPGAGRRVLAPRPSASSGTSRSTTCPWPSGPRRPPSGSPSPPPSSGPSTTRCSRRRGRTGWRSSSPR